MHLQESLQISPGPSAHSPATTELIRAEQIAALYRNGPVGIGSTLVALVILVGVLVKLGGLPPRVGMAFIAAVLLNAVLRSLLTRLYLRAAPPPRAWRTWARRLGLSVCVAGLTIGVGVCFLMIPGRLDLELLNIITVTAIASGVVVAWGSYLPVFFLSFYTLLVPPALWVVFQGDAFHFALALLMVIYMAVGTVMALNYNRGVLESLQLRFENIALVADLRRQKERAEQANLDKSRFLAAASHDLRQPVHALGMFVGALRREPLSVEATQLVSHIEGSVTAMDELFTSLLDVSRLDAGVIEAHISEFPIEPLLARISRELGEEAGKKNLRFMLRGSRAIVRSDPVLLERVLRNLATNAARYTDGGGILLAARPRGASLSIEFWDTGRGIPPDQHENVFQEFFQLDNPERDRGKGLGLGLAIVRRLTALLGCRLELRSQPGRGSVFKVSVPCVAATAGTAPPADLPATAPPAARRGLIAVIDDEVAVRVAMQRLLESWGHTVICGADAAEVIALHGADPRTLHLVISDYRLRDHGNGVEAIARLRAHFDAPIPAMLVTGDTAPDRLREAQASGYLLLHKPVAHGRLRAAIGNLMSEESARPPSEQA
ncbi:MAG: hybrid sensor histidine kinase/response regulator [Gammaproteobacteria bacterium]